MTLSTPRDCLDCGDPSSAQHAHTSRDCNAIVFRACVIRVIPSTSLTSSCDLQFARDDETGDDFAIKFFTLRENFDRESQLYANPALRSMMPAVRAVVPNADGAVRSASGWSFPPCIVIERGESLDKWAQRIEPDFVTILQACFLATSCGELTCRWCVLLAALHLASLECLCTHASFTRRCKNMWLRAWP